MTDSGIPTATFQEAECMKRMLNMLRQVVETNCWQEGDASSSNLGNEPEKDKKTPKRKKKVPNKQVEALMKKAADQKAKHSKIVQELKDLKMLAALEKREKLAQKRKSLLQKDEEMIKTLKEKIHKNPDQ